MGTIRRYRAFDAVCWDTPEFCASFSSAMTEANVLRTVCHPERARGLRRVEGSRRPGRRTSGPIVRTRFERARLGRPWLQPWLAKRPGRKADQCKPKVPPQGGAFSFGIKMKTKVAQQRVLVGLGLFAVN